MLQQKNIGITYVGTSNFKMELVKSVQLYFVVMPQVIITFIEVPFVLALITIVSNIRSRPHTPRGTQFVNLDENFPKEVNKVFASQPSDQGGSGLDPPRLPGPLGYFGLPMVHTYMPPLPPSRPYHRPLNYLEYVKDFDLDVHVKVFKAAIRANSETNDGEIVNLFRFTIRDTMFA